MDSLEEKARERIRIAVEKFNELKGISDVTPEIFTMVPSRGDLGEIEQSIEGERFRRVDPGHAWREGHILYVLQPDQAREDIIMGGYMRMITEQYHHSQGHIEVHDPEFDSKAVQKLLSASQSRMDFNKGLSAEGFRAAEHRRSELYRGLEATMNFIRVASAQIENPLIPFTEKVVEHEAMQFYLAALASSQFGEHLVDYAFRHHKELEALDEVSDVVRSFAARN